MTPVKKALGTRRTEVMCSMAFLLRFFQISTCQTRARLHAECISARFFIRFLSHTVKHTAKTAKCSLGQCNKRLTSALCRKTS